MTKYYLIPWSLGFECRTVKPDGYSIEAISMADHEIALAQKEEMIKKYKNLIEKIKAQLSIDTDSNSLSQLKGDK